MMTGTQVNEGMREYCKLKDTCRRKFLLKEFDKCNFENLFLHCVPVVISVLICVNVLIVNICNINN